MSAVYTCSIFIFNLQSVAGTYNHNILLSLLDGRLLSVDINTGTLLWSLNEGRYLAEML